MNPSPQTSLQVLDTLDMFAKHLNRSDIPAALELLDKEASFIGPGDGDFLRDADAIKGYLERNIGCCRGLGFLDLEVGAVGTVAWVNGHFTVRTDPSQRRCRGRVSAVLKGTGHAWVIAHLHLSLPRRSP